MAICEKCIKSVDVCLNGTQWLCWDHYVEAMQDERERVTGRRTLTEKADDLPMSDFEKHYPR